MKALSALTSVKTLLPRRWEPGFAKCRPHGHRWALPDGCCERGQNPRWKLGTNWGRKRP